MKKTELIMLFWAAVCCLTWPDSAAAQRLYDRERDDQAQAAMKLIGDLNSGTLFDKQIKNLSLLAKRDVEMTLMGARNGMRADINRFITWTDVNCSVLDVKEHLSLPNPLPKDEVERRLAELEPRIKATSDAVEALESEVECKKDPSKCPEQEPGALAVFFEKADELKDIQEAIAAFRAGSDGGNMDVTHAIDEVKGVLGVLEDLYKKYTERMQRYNELKGELLDLQVPLKRVALQSLQVEAQHWKNILRIYVRRGVEEAYVRNLIAEYEASNGRLGYGYAAVDQRVCESIPTTHFQSDNIEMGLRDLVARVRRSESALDPSGQAQAGQGAGNPAKLKEDVLKARADLVDTIALLQTATALAARGRTATDLARLRLAHEEHYYSIRRSGVMARAYQFTVSTGVRRLALYHKGGIKPSVVARLIHAAATVAIPPAIAAN